MLVHFACAFRTKLRAAFDKYSGPYVSIDVLLTWSTQSFCCDPSRKPSSIWRCVRLYDEEADYACDEHVNGIQYFATTDRQHCRISTNHVRGRDFIARHDPLLHLWGSCSWLLFPGPRSFRFFLVPNYLLSEFSENT